MRSEGSAGTPQRSSLATYWATVSFELLVMNTTRTPLARRRAIASAEPGMGSSPNHTTPSRSRSHVVVVGVIAVRF